MFVLSSVLYNTFAVYTYLILCQNVTAVLWADTVTGRQVTRSSGISVQDEDEVC